MSDGQGRPGDGKPLDGAQHTPEDAGASNVTLNRMREERTFRMNALLWTLVLLAVVLIILAALWFSRGRDLTANLGGGSSTAASDIAPPTPADTPEEVLPAAVFEYECADCGGTTVTQIPPQPEQGREVPVRL